MGGVKKNLGCINVTGIFTVIVVLIVIGGVFLISGGSMFSPGGLSGISGAALGGVSSHAGLSGNCAACHPNPFSTETMDQRCLACHQDVNVQLGQSSGLHGLLITNQTDQPCRVCHTDHNGPEAAITLTSLSDRDHSKLGYALTAHTKMHDGSTFTCKACHLNGYTTFDQAVCTNCHTQIDATAMQAHVKAYGTDCIACHDGIDTYGKAFDHNSVVFKLTGKHVSVDCYACHQGNVKLADMKSTSTECVSCHHNDDVHNGSNGSDCGACHNTEDWKQATFDHSKSIFPLVGAHINVACTSCHINNVFVGTPTQCYACHQKDDAHQGGLGQDCGSCHNANSWQDVTFDHSKTTFLLTGAHLTTACTSCHENNTFIGIPVDCYSCHQKDDTHQGTFGQDCGACHTTDSWANATFDHSKTNFPLTGAHVSVVCSQCHVNNVFKGTPTQCNSCHADPSYHLGLFGINCVSCHTTTAWTPATFNGPHHFPLNHGRASSCQACHPTTLANYTCFSCHDQAQMISRHQREGITDITDCVRCHATGRGGD